MAEEFLTEEEAKELVAKYIENEGDTRSTQEILDSGAIPRLKGYVVQPGKVSDSIYGGEGSFKNKKTGGVVEFENPPLNARDGNPLRPMVRTERISTHDISRGSIPFKDQILALNHNFMRRMLAPAIGTSQYEIPGLGDNAVVVAAENITGIEYENVLRAFMAKSSTETSLYVHFMKGEREFCGHKLPDNLFANGPLPYVMDTPSTKSDAHDDSVPPQWLFDNGVCTPAQYNQVRNGSLFGFGKIDQHLRQRGVIPVDTKTEHGVNSKGEVVSKDEIWTMDSSRFWLADDYEKQLGLFLAGKEEELVKYLKETQPGVKEKDYVLNGGVIMCPKSYSKEFARGFSEGDKGYTPEQRIKIGARYIMGIQSLLGRRFEPDMRSRDERVISGLQTVVDELVAA